MYRLIATSLALAGMAIVAWGMWIPLKAQAAQILLHQAWRHSQLTARVVKPWPWADTWPVGRLRQGRLRIDQIILSGASGEALAFGPAHFQRSETPGGWGHVILAGHRDTSFSFLKALQLDDLIELEGVRGRRIYKVVATRVVKAANLYLDTDSSGLLTLITCFPFDALSSATPHRYVVTARLQSDDDPLSGTVVQ